MAPRRRPREGVAEQATRQEVGDAPPPQQTQPLPQDTHSGIVPPPPPPPQVAQGLDMTRFLEGMAQFVAQHRDAPVPQGGTGKVLRQFLQFQPPQFLGQPDPDAARAWLDAVERTFRSMECVPEERVLLASYQLQAQALTWWSSEWETTFQSRPLRQIPWQEFVVSFERAFCPTYVRTKRLYQFLDLQQRDFTVVQYRARFVELGRYAPQIMGDEGLRTQQFVRGLRPELRQALIVARVSDLDAAYQTAAALEADTLRTRARSAEVQTQVVPSQPRQQQGSVQTTPRTATSYASTSTGTTAKSGSRRKFRRDRRQTEQRQQSVGSVQQPTGQPSQQVHRTFAGQCYRCDHMGHMARDCPLLPRVPQQQTQSQPRVQQQQQQAPVQQRQQTGGSGGSRGRGRVTHLTRADAEAAHLVEDSLGGLSSGESVELAVELPTGDFVLTSYCLEEVGLRRLPFQASLATPVLVLPSCRLPTHGLHDGGKAALLDLAND
ncbi:hypothetical protein Taro_022561 [Colocasia esculenta]|uniref:CCHC-type domain-containing protein n=1 Tax=Colocasia esculenta TaxID=4460 RepID=A0A843VET9_COLES|nr:hypothetical protein [Colocasia esculenta]